MKRTLMAIAIAALAGCSTMHQNDGRAYEHPFYAKYLGNSPLDQQIRRDLDGLRANPRSAPLHNDLGQLLIQKGFPKDAEREFERAVDADPHLDAAWYNLGLVRASRDESTSARFAFRRAIHYKPGHAAALFQLGLLEEKRGNREEAVDYYAKAFGINHALLDVHVNPRILDTQLVDQALIRLYPKEHNRISLSFQPTPGGYVDRSARNAVEAANAPSPQAPAANIVTPTAPITNPAVQTPPPTPRP